MQVSLPSVRFDQDGKERKQNFKLCNIETAGGKCFSESAAGPIGMDATLTCASSRQATSRSVLASDCCSLLIQECSASLFTASSISRVL